MLTELSQEDGFTGSVLTSVSVIRGGSSVGQAYVRLMGLKESLCLYAAIQTKAVTGFLK